MAQGGHVCAGVLTTAVISLTSLCLASGRSFVTFKSSATLTGFSYPYGLGLNNDQFGYTWTEGEHLLQVYGCEDHEHLGQYQRAAAFMVVVVSVLATIVHGLGSLQGASWQGLVGVGFQGFNFLLLITALGVGANMYDECHHCNRLLEDFCLKDFFTLNYAIGFYVASIVLTIINMVALFAAGSLRGKQEAAPEESTEPAS